MKKMSRDLLICSFIFILIFSFCSPIFAAPKAPMWQQEKYSSEANIQSEEDREKIGQIFDSFKDEKLEDLSDTERLDFLRKIKAWILNTTRKQDEEYSKDKYVKQLLSIVKDVGKQKGSTDTERYLIEEIKDLIDQNINGDIGDSGLELPPEKEAKEPESFDILGAVQIRRKSPDKTIGSLDENVKEVTKKMVYISQKEFKTLIDANALDALSYYTLDEDYNLIIATWSYDSSDGGVKISECAPIDYVSILQHYSLPFEYSLAFLIDGGDIPFSKALAEIAKDSEVLFEIRDNVTAMKKVHKVIETTKYWDKDGDDYTLNSQTSKEMESSVTVTETNSPKAEVTYIDNWFLNFIKKFTYHHQTSGPTVTDKNTTSTGIQAEIEPDPEGHTHTSSYISEEKTDMVLTTTVTHKYDNGTSEVKGTENKFVDLFQNSKKAEKNVMSEPSWLIEILENNAYTANLVDLTKYLLYKATGKDLGVKEYDFSEFDPEKFKPISSSGGNISYSSLNLTPEDIEILNKITYAERGNGTLEQQEYVVSCILNRVLYSGFPNTVHGVVFQPMQFQPTRNGAYNAAVPSETTKQAVQNVVKGGDTAKGALYFMTPVAAEGQQSWLRNCIFLFNDTGDTNNSDSHNFYTKQEALDELKKYVSYSFSGEFYEIAKQCHDYIRDNQYWYPSQANLNAGGYVADGSPVTHKLPTMGEPPNQRHIDCSAYVSWVITLYTGKEQLYSTIPLMANAMGFQEVSMSDLQPGDIVVKSSHTEIYAGDGRTFNAGSTRAIRSDTSPYSPTFSKAFRAPKK